MLMNFKLLIYLMVALVFASKEEKASIISDWIFSRSFFILLSYFYPTLEK